MKVWQRVAPDSRGGAALEVSGTTQDNGGFQFYVPIANASLLYNWLFVRKTRTLLATPCLISR